MSEMVERVARAIEAETRRQLDQLYVDPPLEYESIARAAILAMREPTQAQIRAPQEQLRHWTSRGVYQAMIDAAVTP